MVGVSLQELEAVSSPWLLSIQIPVLQRDRPLCSSVRMTTQTDKLCTGPYGPKGYSQMASGLGLNCHSFLHLKTGLNISVTCSTTAGWIWVSWRRVTLATTTSGLTPVPLGGAAGTRFIWLSQVNFFFLYIYHRCVFFGIAFTPFLSFILLVHHLQIWRPGCAPPKWKQKARWLSNAQRRVSTPQSFGSEMESHYLNLSSRPVPRTLGIMHVHLKVRSRRGQTQ